MTVPVFRISAVDFKESTAVPKKYTCEGEDISPELRWDDPPEGTKSFALIVEDPDAPGGTFVHWLVYDIPATERRLEPAYRPELPAKQGVTDFGRSGYGGPCPPKGHGNHRYFFVLLALDVPTLGLANGATKARMEKSLKGHVLAEAKTMGMFKR